MNTIYGKTWENDKDIEYFPLGYQNILKQKDDRVSNLKI